MPFFLSLMMSGVVSGISIVRALGFEGIFFVWLGSWFASWLIAFPAVLVVLPLARKLTHLIVEEQ